MLRKMEELVPPPLTEDEGEGRAKIIFLVLEITCICTKPCVARIVFLYDSHCSHVEKPLIYYHKETLLNCPVLSGTK